MKMKWLLLVGLLMAGMAWLLAVPADVSADLPPRPDETGTPSPSSDDEDEFVGAYITLRTNGGTWGMVQWQDANGDWHDVEGWGGQLENSQAVWWVSPQHYKTGPYRWVVYDVAGGTQVAVSDMFYLPGEHQAVISVSASR